MGNSVRTMGWVIRNWPVGMLLWRPGAPLHDFTGRP